MLKFVERHPPKRVPWARCQKISKFTLYIFFFFKKPNKKNYNRAKELSCDATIFVFWFFIVYFLKKIETKKWPKAANFPLPRQWTLIYWAKNFVCCWGTGVGSQYFMCDSTTGSPSFIYLYSSRWCLHTSSPQTNRIYIYFFVYICERLVFNVNLYWFFR